ncbi:MAG TPA: hypothetical protein EYG11_12555 [Candidatus Latescibacteria bacterium]|nr:hypothetical protein [Candidatus Handelsmanbacteria bacterium]HIL09524.1 hypothetical protein [Candidatus Latescibacterota bacterium]
MRPFIPMLVAGLAIAGCSSDDPMSAKNEPAGKLVTSTTTAGGHRGSASVPRILNSSATAGGLAVSSSVAGGLRERGVSPASFTVLIENVSPAYKYSASGVFNTPDGTSAPGAALPGSAYSFSFAAAPGAKLSFATMFVQSNDLFYSPGTAGIELFTTDGLPVTGDITAQVQLWDAGTEVNQEPGVGADQAPRQAGANTGAAEDGVVQLVADGFTYPDMAANIQVTLAYASNGVFTAQISNLSGSSTPLAPGVYAVHTSDAFFTSGSADAGNGLEALAEDGNPADLATALAAKTGIGSPLAPGVFVVHKSLAPLFSNGAADRGEGLEALAEDGNPAPLSATLATRAALNGVFNTPVGASGPGPLLPGSAYSFSFTADPGSRLSFATMFVQSNDLFYAPASTGIALWDASGTPISGDITNVIQLWDAGSEVNQAPGAGPDQAPRQAGADNGAAENGVVQLVNDGFSYPANNSIVRVTITQN